MGWRQGTVLRNFWMSGTFTVAKHRDIWIAVGAKDGKPHEIGEFMTKEDAMMP